ncbi:GNAT family N-acetyltransferase [Sulfobacillus harzensis]|uniref:GNAT family N-acetyltransferase n=1 Tax=Sulfobacillus harzensis TaxID=2729629 RepID=A0A7Y0L2T2_9FIRM|nr:GNAT family N-acetyltransferase [Sulfobacillus harzensis]NMP22033.1 GNAT family N-acetyltransferase [Sulfobacillus harzensis]
MNEQKLVWTIDATCGAVGIDARLEGTIWPLDMPGVKARFSTSPSPLLNLVGMASFVPDKVDEEIDRVIAQYRRENKAFSWLVGPTSTPGDLGARLVEHGLTLVEEERMDGMVLRNLKHRIEVNPRIRIAEVSPEDWRANAEMMAASYGFGMTPETVRSLADFHEALSDQAHVYLAYAEDRPDPIAFSGGVIDESGEVMVLGGAATAPEYRGRGVYSSMVAKRLDDARALGCSMAVVQAVKTTSAPICQQLGFEKVCEIDLYTWMPQ